MMVSFGRERRQILMGLEQIQSFYYYLEFEEVVIDR